GRLRDRRDVCGLSWVCAWRRVTVGGRSGRLQRRIRTRDGTPSHAWDRHRASQRTAEGHPRDAQSRGCGGGRGCLVPSPRARPMRGAALPAALLCVALGLGLASARGKTVVLGLAVLVVTASAIALAPVPESWSDIVFLGCWMNIT